MTLNGDFALKSGMSSTSNGFAFEENCAEICRAIRIYCQRQKCSSARACTGDIRVMELFNGITEQFSHMLFTDACRKYVKYKNNYSGTWKKANMTGMKTKRARGKCIANALVCQLC